MTDDELRRGRSSLIERVFEHYGVVRTAHSLGDLVRDLDAAFPRRTLDRATARSLANVARGSGGEGIGFRLQVLVHFLARSAQGTFSA